MGVINVLVFPAEGANAIELHDALSSCVNIKLFGASSVKRQGYLVFENYIPNVPTIQDENFFDLFNPVLLSNKIDVVIPTHDSVVRFLSLNSDKLASKLLSADSYTSEICRSKIKTYELFADNSFAPRRIVKNDINIEFPLFAKPDTGQGAVGAVKINNSDELRQIDFSSYLVTEYLSGEEYTVDCLTDNHGTLRYISPRTRTRTLGGISVSGHTLDIASEFLEIADIINKKLHFLGLWYFQLKRDNSGKLKLLEISARCAGSMSLTRAKGINLPLLSIYTAMGYDISVSDNGRNVSMEKMLTGVYNLNYEYDAAYIDFDDTIITNGKVNLNLIRFIYQARNNNKKIYLITKHIHDIYQSLRKYAISDLLFDDIIVLDEGSKKSDFIKHESAIFIDNAYKERENVHNTCHIPVFDVDGVEFLLDRKY
jgi:hypothetical protein